MAAQKRTGGPVAQKNSVMEAVRSLIGTQHDHDVCVVCGFPLYATDHDKLEVTYHCSNPEARFWDYDRGTKAQEVAKDHWDRSRVDVFLNGG